MSRHYINPHAHKKFGIYKVHRHTRESDFDGDSSDESDESEDEELDDEGSDDIDEDQAESENQGMSMRM